MELLNGKAKELFLSFMCKTYRDFRWFEYENLLEVCQNVLIIEWLDSVNIAIIIRPKNIKSWDYEVHDYQNMVYIFDCEFESRQEATIEAIKKAVELINESNGNSI